MSDRRSTTRLGLPQIITVLTLVVVIAAGAVYWFGIRDDDAKSKDGSSKTGLTDQTFQASGVPFTFKYPGTFAPGNDVEGFVWIAGVSPVDILDVRRVSGKEYDSNQLGDVMKTKLTGQSGVTVNGQGTNTYDGQPVVTFDVTSGTDPVLQSKLVFFSKGGSTWQLECQSQESNRTTIDAGCSQMLSTLKFS